ncbi:reverse transcriptase [Gossypium australe]|uniref:Reverse transcriptase n=1 Tax=Gossypium australe TaxID=47621 RepID=A0A5B6WRR1_9ROSI|nr:reverse transcriptase [Gossypium australe]
MPIREHVVPILDDLNPGIAQHFKLKPVKFQMLQIVGQFSGLPAEDPRLHLRPFLENAKLRNDIMSFRQFEDEILYEAWKRFEGLIRKCLMHGFQH